MRTNLSKFWHVLWIFWLSSDMAVVCMVNTTYHRVQLSRTDFNENTEEKCSRQDEWRKTDDYDVISFRFSSNALSNALFEGTLEWTPQMQASLLSATFYGSLLTIAISGSMADRFGQKLILIGIIRIIFSKFYIILCRGMHGLRYRNIGYSITCRIVFQCFIRSETYYGIGRGSSKVKTDSGTFQFRGLWIPQPVRWPVDGFLR